MKKKGGQIEDKLAFQYQPKFVRIEGISIEAKNKSEMSGRSDANSEHATTSATSTALVGPILRAGFVPTMGAEEGQMPASGRMVVG